jgi:Flp pilus assembly protein TadG
VRAQQQRRRDSGAFTVEFALVFPVLVAIMFGLIDAGRFIATRTMLAQAAAAAARTACLSSTTDATAIQQAARDATPALGALTASHVCAAACPAFPFTTGTVVRVTVTYNFVAGFYKTFGKTMTNSSLVTC